MKNTSTTSEVKQGPANDSAVAGVNVESLWSFVRRVRALDEENREIRKQLKEAYEEASVEFPKRALHKFMERLRKDRIEIDEDDFLISQWELALGIGPRGEAPEIIRVEDMPDLSHLSGSHALSGLTGGGRARARARGKTNGSVAPHHEGAYAAGREDGLNDHHGSSDLWPPGEYGHGDYMLGWETGHTERVDGQTPIMPAKAPRARRKARADA